MIILVSLRLIVALSIGLNPIFSLSNLVGADVEHKHPDVRNDLVKWGKWIIDEIDACGFRFDAAKVRFPSRFLSI